MNVRHDRTPPPLASVLRGAFLVLLSVLASSCMSQSLWDWARDPTSGVKRAPFGWQRDDGSASIWFQTQTPGETTAAYEQRDLRTLEDRPTLHATAPPNLQPLEALWQHSGGPGGRDVPFVYDLHPQGDGTWVLLAWDESAQNWWAILDLPRDEQSASILRIAGATLVTVPVFVLDVLFAPVLFFF